MQFTKKLPLILLVLAAGAYAEDDGENSGWHTSIGMKADVAPRYLGADDYRVAVEPEFSFSDGTFFLDNRGVGAQYQNDSGFNIAGSIGYDRGRGEKNSSWRPGSKKLKGMGKVKSSALANVSLSQEVTPWLAVNGEVNLPFAGQKKRGQDYRLGVSSSLAMGDSDQLTLGANVHGGSGNFNRTYFGVSPQQSANSGYREHKTKAGIYAYSASAGWEHQFDENWSTGANVGVTRLTGKAGDSPIVKKKTAATGVATVRYDF